MNQNNGDKPAFPRDKFATCPECRGSGEDSKLEGSCSVCSGRGTMYQSEHTGLTKREFFAGQAMEGMLAGVFSNPETMDVFRAALMGKSFETGVAICSYEQADAMLAYQEQPETEESKS